MTNNLNNPNHILNRIINSNNKFLALKVFYMRNFSETDEMYKSYEIALSEELINWIKDSIKKELENLKVKLDDGSLSFVFHNYNDEIDKRDSISILDVNEKGDPIKTALNEMIQSTVKNKGVMKESKFSLTKIEIEDESCFFGYYRGLKNIGNKRKYCLGKVESNDFYEVTQPLIELGGIPSFIIHGHHIYVINPRNFEYAFKYTDHITIKRDENLTRIINMDFFEDPVAKDCFYQKSRGYLRARSISQITDETFMVLEENFKERCEELKTIKQSIEDDPSILNEIKEKSKIILDLMDYLDLDNYKIIFDEESDPTPLLHLFQDKIMESFLTKQIRIAMSI